jgi:uncharacterized sporulation protein YeaH/YhbH (DUF444 family)
MNNDELKPGQGKDPGSEIPLNDDKLENGAHLGESDELSPWAASVVANLNVPPERTLPSVVLPEPPYFDRTIVDGGDLMRNVLVAADGETYWVPSNLLQQFTAGEIDVPITIDEPSWNPGRDRPGGGGNGPQASEDDSDIIYMPISYDEFIELIGLLFDLPFLKPTDADKILTLSLKTRGVKRNGPMARLDKLATAKARLERFFGARNARPEEFAHLPSHRLPTVKEFPFHKVDLRFRRIEEVWDPDSKAVIFYELDTSGSMYGEPLNMAKFFFLLMLIWLRSKYERVTVVYIAHSGNARRIRDEKDFFRVDANGGTRFTDAHELVVSIANSEFAGDGWNRYALHATDGYEQTPQGIAAAIDKIIRAGFNLFGYLEVDLWSSGWGFSWGGSTPGWQSFDYLSADTKPRCGRARVKTMDEVPDAMKTIIDIENKS